MLEQKEERRYRRLRKMGQELHVPIPEAFWELEVRDRNGRVIQKHRQRSHSWVRNAYHLMFQQLAHVPYDSAKSLNYLDTGGVSKTNATYIITIGQAWSSVHGYWAAAGIDTYGIVVGSNDAAESFEHYSLQTQIMNGSGAGQLAYIAGETPVISTVDTTKKAELVRFFNNNSGGSIDVKEVGLYAHMSSSSGGSVNFLAYIMTSRDKLTSTVTVPDTGQLKVTYTIQLTYPA